jgi:hypothetical protein
MVVSLSQFNAYALSFSRIALCEMSYPCILKVLGENKNGRTRFAKQTDARKVEDQKIAILLRTADSKLNASYSAEALGHRLAERKLSELASLKTRYGGQISDDLCVADKAHHSFIYFLNLFFLFLLSVFNKDASHVIPLRFLPLTVT